LLKPIFKWPGGKSREIECFQTFIPQSFSQYIEPFVGGGALYFYLQPKKSIISDIDSEIINFYLQIKIGNRLQIYKILKNWKNDAKTYYYVRDDLWKEKDNIVQATRFYYLNKTSFRGMIRYNKNGKFNIPFGNYKRDPNFENLLDSGSEQLLQKTEVFLCDYKDIFTNYNDTENFIFLDPPYDSEFRNYGKYCFGKEDHIYLSEAFKLTKNRCLLIIGKTDFTFELYKNYIVGEYDKIYSFRIYRNRVGKEINNSHFIVKNF